MKLVSFGCRGARSRAGAGRAKSTPFPGRALLGPAAPGRRWPDTSFSPGDARPVRDTRPVYVTGRGQWACRQMALRTRSRSTCLRPTSKGSAALIVLASHAPAPPVHPAPVMGAAGRGARSCGITSAQTSVSAGLIPLRWKIPKTLPARDAPGSAGWVARRARWPCSARVSAGQPGRRSAGSAPVSPGPRRSARVRAGQPGSAPVSPGPRRSARVSRVSPGGSRPPAAPSHGAEGAGNHTRCRRGSRRDGAPGMERRSCAYLLAISARRQEEVRAAARS